MCETDVNALRFEALRYQYDREPNFALAIDLPLEAAHVEFVDSDAIERVKADLARPSWRLVRSCKVEFDATHEPATVEVCREVFAADLTHLQSLHITGVLDDEILKTVAATPMPNLKQLKFYGGGKCSEAAFQQLAHAECIPHLTNLRFDFYSRDSIDGFLRELRASGQRLSQLECLQLNQPAPKTIELLHLLEPTSLRMIRGLSQAALESLNEMTELAAQIETLHLFVFGERLPDSAVEMIDCLVGGAFRNLQGLMLSTDHLVPDGTLRSLGGAPFRDRLKSLWIPAVTSGDAGWKALAETELPNLEYLNLHSSEATSAGADALFRSPLVKKLRDFRIHRNRLTDADFALLGETISPSLRSIEITSERESPNAVARLLSPGRTTKLEELLVLSCSGKAILDLDAIPAPIRQSLRNVRFGSGRVKATKAKRSIGGFPKLERLSIGSSKMAPAVWDLLSECGSLLCLELAGCPTLDLERLEWLLQCDFFERLLALDLDYVTLEDAGAEMLAGSNFRPVQLQLHSCDFTEAGHRRLLSSPIMDRVAILALEDYTPDEKIPAYCYRI